eukprot:scpid12036/ scgid31808/ Phosphoinositide 3-kinase regulatory subunit 4
MGNLLVNATPGQIVDIGTALNELPPIFETKNFKSLGSTRFFKVARINHEEGPVVVKILVKPENTSLDLQQERAQLQEIRDLLVSTNNCLPFHDFLELDRIVVLIRQHVRYSLYDRISTRPYLNPTEKLWILYQLLNALKECHSNGVCHGDIKAENVLVTSWNWVLLTDFASYKPTYLQQDDPSNFSFFFDASRRRVCYIAPERFVDRVHSIYKDIGTAPTAVASSPPSHDKLVPIPSNEDTGGVDAASAPVPAAGTSPATGDPAPVASLSGSAPGYSSTPPTSAKVAINPAMNGSLSVTFVAGTEATAAPTPESGPQSPLTKEMDIFSMGCVVAELFRNGKPLFNFSELLAYQIGEYDPQEKLEEIKDKNVVNLILDMIALDPAKRISAVQCMHKYKGVAFPRQFSHFLAVYCRRFSGQPIMSADDRIARLCRDWQHKIVPNLLPEPANAGTIGNVNTLSGIDRSPVPGTDSLAQHKAGQECFLILASIVMSSIRACITFHSKHAGVNLLTQLAMYTSDEVALERYVPFLVHMLSDRAGKVVAAAILGLSQCMMRIKKIPKSDVSVFPEYIFPAMAQLSNPDKDLVVRLALAENIVTLAQTSMNFLELSVLAAREASGPDHPPQEERDQRAAALSPMAGFDSELIVIREMVQKQIVALLCDPVNMVKRALLGSGINRLCLFFGRQKSNDVLLSHMITFQNDKQDAQLRGAFFDSIVPVAVYVGSQSLSMVMPLLQQGLGDFEVQVVTKALEALRSLSYLGLFHKLSLHQLSLEVLPLLCHPAFLIRSAAVGFLSMVARKLSVADLQCLLLPNLQRYLTEQVVAADNENILLALLKPPLSQKVYDNLVQFSNIEEFFFWLDRRGGKRRQHKPQLNYAPMSTSEELQALLNKVSPLSDQDEESIWAMKDYIKHVQRKQTMSKSDTPTNLAKQGRIARPHRDIRVIGVRNEPKNETHMSLATASNPPQRNTLTKKAITQTDSASMSEEWNQMFGTSKSSSSSSSSRGKEATPADKGTGPRRGDSRKSSLRNRSETATPSSKQQQRVANQTRKTPVVRSSRSQTQADASPGAAGGSSSSATGTPQSGRHSSSETSEQSPMKPSSSNTGSAAATTGGTQGGPFRQPIFHAHDYRLSGRHTTEDRPRLCRQELESMLEHRHTQYMRCTARIEELASVRQFESNTTSPGWVPAGTNVAHMHEHRSCINQIVVAEDNSLYATCSDDSSVRVWDSSRLQGRSVLPHRSVATYDKQGGRINSLLFLNPTKLASASTDGSLDIICLTGDQRISALRQDSPLMDMGLARKDHLLSLHAMNSGRLLVSSTLYGRIVACDTRVGKPVWSLQNPLKHGLVTSAALDRLQCWLAVGTEAGVHALWDLRFHMSVSTWTHPAKFPIQQLAPHPMDPWCLISSAGANNEVSLWNMETSSRSQVFCSGAPLATNRSSNHFIRSFCVHHSLGGNALMLGGSDRRVRLFNMANQLESRLLLPPVLVTDQEVTTAKYRKHQLDGISVVQELVQTTVKTDTKATEEHHKPRPPAVGHLDAITGMAVAHAGGQNFLLTASRDGVLKVWK